MATSFMLIDRDGEHHPVDRVVHLRATTKAGVLAAVRRALAKGENVHSAYLGGPYAIALAPRVYPPKRPA